MWLSSVNTKVRKQSIQKDKLISKCTEMYTTCLECKASDSQFLTEIETHIQKQEDILNHKENEIKALQHFINKQQQTLK
ncbi:hypothetical protein lerEdw1_006474 [Lerista edwardsae]|nr:hypothetical protein lerEdw1_006474 [Lerista edwardsae]